MSTMSIEEQVAEVRRRIEELDASGGMPRLQRHVDLIDDIEQKLAQLRTRLDVAERSLTADAAPDWPSFAAAVEDELERWDTYLERVQTTVATRAWNARERAEAAIGDVRGRRIAVDERLASVGTDVDRLEARKRVTAARDELQDKADELSAKFI